MNLHAQMMAGGTSNPGAQTAFVISQRSVATTILVVAAGVTAQYFIPDYVEILRSNWLWVFLAVVAASILWTYVQLYFMDSDNGKSSSLPQMFEPIPFTFDELKWYDGSRNSRAARLSRGGYKIEDESKHPLPKYDGLVFVAVKGVVYNVAHEYYGPGAGYSIFSAKDSSRQLGKVIVADTETNADWTTLDAKQLGVLDDWEDRYRSKYAIVGWVVPDDAEEYVKKGEGF